jgi:hypothetical protein
MKRCLQQYIASATQLFSQKLVPEHGIMKLVNTTVWQINFFKAPQKTLSASENDVNIAQSRQPTSKFEILDYLLFFNWGGMNV